MPELLADGTVRCRHKWKKNDLVSVVHENAIIEKCTKCEYHRKLIETPEGIRVVYYENSFHLASGDAYQVRFIDKKALLKNV